MKVLTVHYNKEDKNMAIYLFSSHANQYSEFKSAVNDNAYLSLEYDDSSDGIVFSHSGLGITISVDNLDVGVPILYIGDGYTSGNIPDNSIQMMNYDGEPMNQAGLLVHENHFIYFFHETSTIYFALVCAKLENGDTACILIGNLYESMTSGYLLSTKASIQLVAPEVMGIDAILPNGNYLQFPAYVSSSGSVVINGDGTPSQMLNVYVLFKALNDANSVLTAVGTNAIVNGREHGSATIKEIVLLLEGLYQ